MKISMRICLFVFLLCITVSTSAIGEEFFLPFGTPVMIDMDARGNALGKPAKYIGAYPDQGYMLIDECGNLERETYRLPEGYALWDAMEEEWPGGKTALKGGNPVFEMEDGSWITGLQCYWSPTDPEVNKLLWQEIRKLFEALRKIPCMESRNWEVYDEK